MRQLVKHLFTVNGERCHDVVQEKVFRRVQVAGGEAGQKVGASVADNYNGWVLPPLVICAVGAHKEILVKTESKSIRWLRCVKKSIETTGIRASGITRKTQVRGAMKRMKILATLLATIAFALPAAAQYDETAKSFHLLPHLADGGGWQSVLLVTNVSQSASHCTFNVYGVPLNRFREFSGATAAGSTATFQLEGPGGYLTWRTKNELAAVASGYATLDCSAPVVAQVVFAWFDGLGVTGMATVFSSQAATVFQFPVLQPAATLGFAIANDTNAEASCRILLEDYQRTNLGEATLSVPAKSNRAQMLHAAIDIPGTFLGGSATVSCNQPVAMIGLHFELRPDGTIITFSTLPPAILSSGTFNRQQTERLIGTWIFSLQYRFFRVYTNLQTERCSGKFKYAR